jgi:hypothetical protein
MKKLLLIFLLLMFGYSCKTPKQIFTKPNETFLTSDSCLEYKETDNDGLPVFNDKEKIRPKIIGNKKESNNKKTKASIISNKDDVVLPGVLVYHIPDTMSVFTDYMVKIRIIRAKDTTNINITSNIGGKNQVQVIKTTEKMYVDLIDSSPDSSFVIKKINDNEQLVDSNDYTEWVYSVRPIKNGDKKLSLVISIIKGANKKQIVYSDTIYVKDNIVKEVKSFWEKYWQWLFSTFLIPIFIYFWKKRDKKNNS